MEKEDKEERAVMLRADHDLAFLLQYENVAWYEKGAVRILDRRRYPKVEHVNIIRRLQRRLQIW